MNPSSPEANSQLPPSDTEDEPGLSPHQAVPQHATSPEGKPGPRPVYRCRTGRCGRCLRCLDNARWERIFTEKFADPTYYEDHLIKHCSPLA